MPINATKSEAHDFERPAAGTYSAVCQSVHNLGAQKITYLGREKVVPQIVIVWEIDERIKNGDFKDQRFVVSQTFTLSMYEKAKLRQTLKSWRGVDWPTEEEACAFDLERLISAPCMITLVDTNKNGKTYQNIATVSKLPKGMTPLTPELEKEHVFKWIENKKSQAIKTNEVVQEHPEIDGGAEEVPF